MRAGPHPLPVHLGMVAANMSGIQKYASNFSSSLSEGDAVKMMRGIKMYKAHKFITQPLPMETIWQNGGVRVQSPIMNIEKPNKGARPLLLVPSLINKANILDISQSRSMLRWFKENGINACILDWGDFTHSDEKDIDINEIIKEKLCGAIRHVSEMAGMPVDVLGYCMGGALLLPSYTFVGQYIRRMTLLATPWDFHTGASEFARNVRIWSPSVLPIVRERGCLPSEWVQALFASLDSNGSAQKFINFASMDQSSSEAELFVSVEDWLNDGINLPKNIAQHCIQDWFVDNILAKGEWHIAGKHINTNEINAQILIVASHADKLVPYDCAINVQKDLCAASVDIVELNCGHIGLIVGRNAIETVWQPILKWLKKK